MLFRSLKLGNFIDVTMSATGGSGGGGGDGLRGGVGVL